MDTTPITTERLVELVRLARADAALWAEFKANECEIERWYAGAEQQGRDPGRPPPYPLAANLLELVDRRYPDENFSLDEFVLILRRIAREEAGLSTELFLWVEAKK